MKRGVRTLIEVEHLTKRYGSHTAVDDISFTVQDGCIYGLLGPNGAGKSTTMNMITGYLAPTGGTVAIDGHDVQEEPKEAKACIGYLPELPPLYQEMTVQEYLLFVAELKGTRKKADRAAAVEHAVARAGLQGMEQRLIRNLSKGYRQRVGIGAALLGTPKIIILDEPTSFLDIRYKLEFLSIIQNMSRERNLSVIMSLHELDLAGRISDKIACVRGDKVDRFGTPEEIFTQGYIPQLYQMTTGSYDERTGDLELPKTEGEPKVFVIAGNGTGTAVFRKLQRERVPFVTGILWENDLDYPAAKALATEVISVKPFGRIEEKEIQKAKEWIKKCDKVICTLDVEKSGEFAKPLSRLFEMCK